jgi:hypothetical protein
MLPLLHAFTREEEQDEQALIGRVPHQRLLEGVAHTSGGKGARNDQLRLFKLRQRDARFVCCNVAGFWYGDAIDDDAGKIVLLATADEVVE